MAKRKPPVAASVEDLLGQFSDRLSVTARVPNAYRFKPMPVQDLFLQSQAKLRVLFGGNRAGKTHIGVADEVLVLMRRHPYRQHLYPEGPLRMRFIGVDFERGIDQGAIPKFQELLPASYLINGSWDDSYSASQHMLTLLDGSTVSFMSYEQSANKFQIVSLHHTHFDEEPPKAIYDEDKLRHVDVAGTVTISETPVQQLEWIQDEIIEPAEAGMLPNTDIFYLSTLDNVNLPEAELAELVATMSAEEQVVRLQGRYKAGSLVFPEFERKYPFVIPAEGFRLIADHHAVYESMDHGYVNPTSWNWTAVAPDGGITIFKQLYASGLVVDEWAKAVKNMRRDICVQYGLTPRTLVEMTRGTFGDPAIADSGNAAAQSGITIQQAYAIAGIHIATAGIRQARAGNQNIGLDKLHTYLRLRPDKSGIPWQQITDECTPLIDELKKARKPKQLAANQAVKSSSEAIRDKDNHAIDAQKYLYIVTHDLRPMQHRSSNSHEAFVEMGKQMGAIPTAFTTHREVLKATMSSHTPWKIVESDSYASLED
jgi:phage terminase large subunit-like protein